jgi:hypothetical protein
MTGPVNDATVFDLSLMLKTDALSHKGDMESPQPGTSATVAVNAEGSDMRLDTFCVRRIRTALVRDCYS